MTSDYGALPVDLVFVRHGESEGNLAEELSWKGDESLYEVPAFKAKHTSRYRLTSLGREQAAAAGNWLKGNGFPRFDTYLCSEYIRARETAALLQFKDAAWHIEFYLRERDQGYLSGTSQQERRRNQQMQFELARRDLDWFYWAPVGGESIADCCVRCDRVMSQLSHTCQGLRVLVVGHGNIMVSFRIRLEQMDQRKLRSIMDDAKEKMENGHILHYSRRDPISGEVGPHLSWLRSVCPWDMSKGDGTWRRIVPRRYTNEELMETVLEVPQAFDRPLPTAHIGSIDSKSVEIKYQ